MRFDRLVRSLDEDGNSFAAAAGTEVEGMTCKDVSVASGELVTVGSDTVSISQGFTVSDVWHLSDPPVSVAVRPIYSCSPVHRVLQCLYRFDSDF